uniref:Ataxin-10 homolog n=1 Tax=Ustilago sp. SL-2014 TaxID=1593447 RepID=A0A0B5A2W6_9BASI|nr:aldo-keto reductase [Ustilago sp. SL-2014]
MQASEAMLPAAPSGSDALRRLIGGYLALVQSAPQPRDQLVRELEAYKDVKSYLLALGQHLAQDGSLRTEFAGSGALVSLIGCIGTLYATFEQVQSTRPNSQMGDPDPLQAQPASTEAKEQSADPYYRVSHIATLCLRALRNALAGCAEAQSILCSRFDNVAPLLTNLTRFHTLNDPDTLLLARAAIQMLSNLITANEEVQQLMWPRIVMTSQPEHKLALNFLSSPDTATQSAAQILLINFIRAPNGNADARRRCMDLCTLTEGLSIVETLLSASESIMLRTASVGTNGSINDYDPEIETEGLEESLGFIYTIFSILFETGHSSMLFAALSPLDEISLAANGSVPSEPVVISSSQLILLKLLDSWLHSSQQQAAISIDSSSTPGPSRTGGPTMAHIAPETVSSNAMDVVGGAGLLGLLDAFAQLSRFACNAMARGTAKDGADADAQPQDRRLIGVHHALLLVLQCLLSVSMTADGWSDASLSPEDTVPREDLSFSALSARMLSSMRSNTAFVDELVALLDQTHQYAPALSPFRPTKPTDGSQPSGDAYADRPMPEGHALSSTGLAGRDAEAEQAGYGFDHLKRDIVRVLGSLVYAPTQADVSASASEHTKTQIRQVQDQVREKGGLFHVLNMTVLDERNPYMREYAIFALRYLLANNLESQKLVGSLQPAQPQDGSGGVQLPMV